MNSQVAARPDVETSRAYWTLGRNDAERAFVSARRHSAWVRRWRILLPSAAAFSVLVTMLWSWLNPLAVLDRLPVKIGDTTISGTKITMQAPRLSGYTRDQRAYELTATSAAQDITRPDVLELQNIRAKIQMQDKGMTDLTARNGLYDTNKEVVTLGDDVYLVTSSYKAWMTNAVIDTKSGNVASDKAVKVQMLQGLLNANRFQVKDNGDLMVFEGNVVMDMKGDAFNAQRGAASPPPEAATTQSPVRRNPVTR